MDNQENRYQVCIRCFTFNHRNYIEDAMHGFVMQQTEFPYVAVVVDDASTDGEPEVIKRFLEKEFDMASAVQNETDDFVKVVAKHKTNVNCTFVVVFLKYNHYSIKKRKLPYFKEWHDNAKYIAICEGDDYWTDPLKLQKQVDFLESHLEYSLCFHPVLVLRPDGSFSNEIINWDIPESSYESDVLKGNYITTQSVIYRNISQINDIIKTLGNMPFTDYVLWLLNTRYGLLYEIPEVMAVYRWGTGVWTTKTKFEQNIDSVYGYTKMLPLVLDPNNRQVFDQRILDMIKQLKLEYNNVTKERNKVLQSKEYKLGIFLLKPIKKLKRFLRNRFHAIN